MMTTFFILSFLLLTFILITPNAIHGLLGLILLFCNFALVLFTVKVPFLGFAYILVYIGAICVLFLYIILLLNLRSYSLVQRINFYLLGALTISFFISFTIFMYVKDESLTAPFYQRFIAVSDLELYTHYLFNLYPFHLLAAILLLLVALILAIFVSSSLQYQRGNRDLIKNLYNS
jgi:NADH:ubiquinone oxidoreductase subunit 6 (subunit J)